MIGLVVDPREYSFGGDPAMANTEPWCVARDGLLSVLSRPEGNFGEYVDRVAAEENADRLVIMRQLAAERRMPLADVHSEQGELWRKRSFSGEWIEVAQDNNAWGWVQKK